MMTATTKLSVSEQRIYAYLQAHRDGATYLMGVSTWAVAEPFILATGQEILLSGDLTATLLYRCGPSWA
jgi:hypothetical protein